LWIGGVKAAGRSWSQQLYRLLYGPHQKSYQQYPAKKLMPWIAELFYNLLDLTGCGLGVLSQLVAAVV